MSRSRSGWICLIAAVLLLVGPAAFAVDKVVVNATVSGAAAPNRTVTGAVSIDIKDGSTLESVTWMQTFGAPAKLTGRPNHGVSIKLAPAWSYRTQLIKVASEPPITQEQLPPNVPLPPGEFPGGLQDRFQVVGINPFTLEEAAVVKVEVEVVTTSGTYTDEVEITVNLPYQVTTGLKNVPVKVPVVLYGKTQASYNWTLTRPSGSRATLTSANTQSPYFTPDVPGIYEAKVTDLAANAVETLTVYAGTWRGVIVGEDVDGRPIADAACTRCHGPSEIAPDKFTPWRETGHAEIFKDNINTSTHYSTACFSCHTVGFNLTASNNGADDTADYPALVASGLIEHAAADNYAKVLDRYPEFAMRANIQCENCHGPQVVANDETPAHGLLNDSATPPVGEPRISLSSDVCASCHGEPLRHARFQQWQLSAHANYEVAEAEGTNGNCARCHTANGFLKWVDVLTGEKPGDPLANITVDWTVDEIHPQTCVTCHDPHANGTTTGVTTNATVRIAGDTPPLVAGFKAIAVGKGAICMTCHNSRRGLKNDTTYSTASSARAQAPHLGVQADVLMGENAYLVNTGVRGRHSYVEDTCVNCHMEKTPPPADLAYQQGGTNHTFYAKPEVCNQCHTGLEVTNLQHSFEAVIEDLKADIEAKILDVMDEQIQMGNTIDIGGKAVVRDVSKVAKLELTESHGQQAISITFTNGGYVEGVTMTTVKVVRPAPLAPVEFYAVTDDALPKAVWNYLLIEADGSKGVHNPTWIAQVLDASRDAIGGGGAGTPRIVIPVVDVK